VAIYHLSVKTISRSAGRSATAAAAYRAGVQITDERTGDLHDYSRRGGVESSELVLPVGAPSWASDRSALWNAAEQAEKRKNSTVAREFEIALPVELSPVERRDLAVSFARELVERHGCAADVCIHAPGKEGDNRNHHAHVLLTTRRLGREGFGEKTRELDEAKTGAKLITQWRERFASMQNERLQAAGIDARVDHRTLADQGIDRAPTVHLGPAAVGYERRTGEVSRKREDWGIEAEAFERLRQAKASGEQERRQVEGSILDLSHDLKCALAVQALQERMSVQEVDEDIRRLDQRLGQRVELPRVADLVEIDPLVVQLIREQKELEETRQDLYRKLQEAEKNEQLAIQWTTRYRTDSPFLTKMHDLGVLRSASLDDFERVRIESAQARTELMPRIEDVRVREAKAKQQQIEARSEAERRIAREQAPLLQQIAEERKQIAEEKAELMDLRDRKTGRVRVQEQPESTRDYARESAGRKFEKWASSRRIRCAGWGDRGEDWQTLPPVLREAIETYNATPAEGRPAVLARLVGEHQEQIGKFEKLQKRLDRGR
jgi:hypothetical protein